MKLVVIELVIGLVAVSLGAVPQSRIIDGLNARYAEAPYIVSLQLAGERHFCAGSIIHKNWVLTAGHCLIYSSFYAVAGLNRRSQTLGSQVRKISSKRQFFIHEKYEGDAAPYDIGLIHIPQDFEFIKLMNSDEPPVSIIRLPRGQSQFYGDGVLYGWGHDRSDESTDDLQKVDARIMEYAECKNELPSNAYFEEVNICSFSKGANHYESSCDGDSGGPFVKYNEEGVELIGIVSWGYTPCKYTTYPSIYTRVSSFIDWIDEIIASKN